MVAQGTEPRRVWFLGAGFSKSLGGPLLPDLLSLNAMAEVRARYMAGHFLLQDYRLVYWLYHFGSQFKEGVWEGQQMTGVRAWQDAEEFLELLSVATTSPATRNKIERLMADVRRPYKTDSGNPDADTPLPAPPSAADLDVLARRLVGAACCAFLEEVDESSVGTLERWRPYREWFSQLNHIDTLVTFNYDRVIELLNGWRVGAGGSSLTVVTDVTKAEMAKMAVSAGRGFPLLKLHGSVDWKKVSEGSVERVDGDPRHILRCAPTELALATPGPAKAQVAGELFEAMWLAAEDALAGADEIYFVGYRAPPADAEARARLFGALHRNTPQMLNVHIVLGPEKSHSHVTRLVALLEHVLRAAGRRISGEAMPGSSKLYRISVHGMGAEDFLSIWTPAISLLIPS